MKQEEQTIEQEETTEALVDQYREDQMHSHSRR